MRWSIFAAALVGFSIPIPAQAYVRTTTTSGTPIAWTTGCLQDQLDTTPNPDLSTDRERAALKAALAQWNHSQEACTKMTVSLGPDIADANVAFDGHSVVLWRLHGFCDTGKNAQDEACLAPNATATTTVFFHDKPGEADDGKIEEADMEVNAVHFDFDDTGDPNKIDLQEVFAHESGHALGLDHTCYSDSAQTPLLDGEGNPQPFCFPVNALPASVQGAAMYPFTAPGEVDKRGPMHDETAAVCSIYAGKSATCDNSESDGSGGCSVAKRPQESIAWGALFACFFGTLLLVGRRWGRR